ncbi:dihydrodipicolinate reductase [Brockia lithotrophica]|uniref:4-hydroxy-tetrahydrodipicolinate reductase n=1 Tax=Brockia lithotrophica TaxID=933949 RepID=A0A660LBM6_9BACL|nr:4-hydroxy-tetrahydrodipicolinate reductase [Brockia lithotrophica]RKQ89010.1 dihydrodipicolinate reductase [Brockia lithotrophica]
MNAGESWGVRKEREEATGVAPTPVRVAVGGAFGRMGREAVELVRATEHFLLVGTVDRRGRSLEGVPGFSSVDELFSAVRPDVYVDFTSPEAVYGHTRAALEAGVRPVVGTTGLAREEIEELAALARSKRLGAVIAPNFSLGAAVIRRAAALAARFFPHVEIVEMHHDQKKDAPSGTALLLAEAVAEARGGRAGGVLGEAGSPPSPDHPARGVLAFGVPVHSVRLPGFVAHHELLFGGDGEWLTLRVDTVTRRAFMPGLRYAVERVLELEELVYGLDRLLERELEEGQG